MAVQLLKTDVYTVGAIDWDNRLFDELIPLPDGTSYNAYLIKGSDKTALIDTVEPSTADQLLGNLAKLDIEWIDYVIANHAEQDHSGSLPIILEKFPAAKVVTNKKCQQFLLDMLHIDPTRFKIISDGESLSLGNKTLEFHFTPWVHWPETMCTYLKEDRILFTCDFFGSHLATSDLFVTDTAKVIEEAKRYYAQIMMPFRSFIVKNIATIRQLGFDCIAPSHGPVYANPEEIMAAYEEWVSDRVTNTVLIPYVSMHGSTEAMVNHLVDALIERGISVIPFNLIKTDLGQFAMALVDAPTVILGTSTVLNGPHPTVIYAASIINALKPKTRFVSIVGSYSWGGKTIEILKNNLTNLKIDYIDPVFIKGYPRVEDFQQLDHLAETILEKHQGLDMLD